MEYAKYLSVILASMLKFIGGPLAGLALQLTWIETAICTLGGMMTSVLLVVFAHSALDKLMLRYRKTPPRLFSKRTRFAVKVWRRSGITGIALLTPLLLTPIGGTALAVSFRVSPIRIILAMLLSGVFWGLVFTVLVYQLPALL
jgi:uncharacterized membrane protein YeiH